MPKYIAIPADRARTWGDIFDHAAARYGIRGNDFIGSRQYNAPSGVVVFKLDV